MEMYSNFVGNIFKIGRIQPIYTDKLISWKAFPKLQYPIKINSGSVVHKI